MDANLLNSLHIDLFRWANRADDDNLTPEQNQFAMEQYQAVAHRLGLSDDEAIERWEAFLAVRLWTRPTWTVTR